MGEANLKNLDYFRFKIEKGWAKKNIPNTKEYRDRLEYEIQVISKLGFVDYMLMIADIVEFSHRNALPVGYGRGSVCGSLIAYAMDITHIDPIKYNLYFERFLNPDRVSLPDIDLDNGTKTRHLVFDYIVRSYGEECVASIATFGKMFAKAIIRNVGMALNMPTGPGSDVDIIAKLFPSMEKDFRECVDASPALQEYEKKYPKLFKYAEALSGKPKSVGVHAAGTVVTPVPIMDLFPMGRGTGDKTSVTQWDMYDVEAAGFVKLDLLGLNTLDIIANTVKLIKENHGVDVDIRNVPTDDPDVIKLFASGKTTGIFQLERKYVQELCKRMDIKDFDDICAINALIRPGTLHSGATELYIKRKTGKEEYKCPHPSLEKCLERTLGILLYQETIMKCVVDYAGFTMPESDTLRKCVSGNNYFITRNGTYTVKEVFDKFNKGSELKILCSCNGKHVYKRLINIWSNGIKKTIKLKTKSGYFIECTEDHPIFTNNGWKNAGDITKEDYLAVFDKYIQKGFGKMNKDMAKVSGLFISEGCYTEKTEMKITNSNKGIIKFIENTLNKNFGEDSFYKRLLDNGCFDIYIKGEAKKWFESRFKKGRSSEKEIPICIKNESKDVVANFLAGYFDGDGTVSCLNVSYCTASDKIARFLQISLMRFGVSSCICVKKLKYNGEDRKYYNVYISSRKSISLFYSNIGKYCVYREKIDKIINILKTNDCFENEKYCFPNNIFISCINKYSINDILDGIMTVSGSMYKKNMTYSKVSFLNKFLGDEMIEYVLNADYKYSKVASIENIGEQEVFDFTVDSNEHSAYINGILVHNCIGKKKIEEVEKMKSKFFNGARKLGRPDSVTEVLWNQIDAAKLYSFNASHCYGYGLVAYHTGWLKTHYFKEYMTCLLNGELNSNEPKVDVYLRECRMNKVMILPPDARRGNSNFSIEDGKIRFGLNFIKGVTERCVNELSRLNDKLYSFTDLLMSATGDMNQIAMTNLILAGAFDYLKKDRYFILELYLEIKKRVKLYKEYLKKVDSGVKVKKVLTLEDIYEKEKNFCYVGETMSEQDKLKMEYDLCQCYITNDPMKCFEKYYDEEGFSDIEDLLDEAEYGIKNKQCKILAITRNLMVRAVKNGKNIGRSMASMEIFDTTKECEAVIFPDTFESVKEKVFDNAVYIMRGSYNGNNFIIRDLELIQKNGD